MLYVLHLHTTTQSLAGHNAELPPELSAQPVAQPVAQPQTGSHLDLMLAPAQATEAGKHPLLSFRLPAELQLASLAIGEPVHVEQAPHHRAQYLYIHQRQLTKNRGTVKRIAAGQLTWHTYKPESSLVVTLHNMPQGANAGAITLSLTRSSSSSAHWTLTRTAAPVVPNPPLTR